MKATEFRKLIREEVRKVVGERKSIREGLFSGEPSGPFANLVKDFDAVSNKLDKEQKIKMAWKNMPKDTLQTSYNNLDPGSQKEFEALLTSALQGSSIVGIIKLCKFILLRKDEFDTKVVNVCSQIAQM